MTDGQLAPATTPDTLFVIACPACLGHVSVAANLGGRLACCPLCAATFVIPEHGHAVPPAAAPGPPEPDLEPPATTTTARQLRRLSDEERQRRRSRRTLVLLLVGAAILTAIVFVLGGTR